MMSCWRCGFRRLSYGESQDKNLFWPLSADVRCVCETSRNMLDYAAEVSLFSLRPCFFTHVRLLRSLVHGLRRTVQAIKPDGVQRQLVGEVITRFEKKGYKLVAMKVRARF